MPHGASGWNSWQLRGSRGPRRVFLPAALDGTAFNVPTPISRLNFLRPSGLPAPANLTQAMLGTIAQSLCKQLTESPLLVTAGTIRRQLRAFRGAETGFSNANGRAVLREDLDFPQPPQEGRHQAGPSHSRLYTPKHNLRPFSTTTTFRSDGDLLPGSAPVSVAPKPPP
jgi:hypothetical protein